MILHSKTISLFTKSVRAECRRILQDEMKLVVRKTRFCYGGYNYPLTVVVFENSKIYGYFEPFSYQIGINKNLMYLAKRPILKDIIRHELAHYITYLKYGREARDHGPEYRETCREFGWDERVWKRNISLEVENEKITGDLERERIIERIKKLLSLASSDNIHESEMATLKANQLLIQYNLKQLEIENSNDDETVYVKRVLKGKKNSSKYQAIFDILKTFYVSPVYNYGKGGFYLEVVGSKLNVEMADYVASFLDNEFERLWKIERKNNSLSGIRDKNSFMVGLKNGYLSKLQAGVTSQWCKSSLVKMEQSLEKKLHIVYPRLSSINRGGTTINNHALELGKNAGSKIQIRRGLKGSNSVYLLD